MNRPVKKDLESVTHLLIKLEDLLAAQYRYTTSLAAGAVVLSVNFIEKFGSSQRMWLLLSWAAFLLVILSGVVELERLKKTRNRALRWLARGESEPVPTLWDIARPKMHEQGFVWGVVFLAGAGCGVLFPEYSEVSSRAAPVLASMAVVVLVMTVALRRWRLGSDLGSADDA